MAEKINIKIRVLGPFYFLLNNFQVRINMMDDINSTDMGEK